MLPLPPGQLGLPWLGETLPFLKDPFGFMEERRRRYGDVFRTRILGEDVIALSGPDAITFFYDTRYFTRADASPPNLQEILHPDAVTFLDDSEHHRKRRSLMMHAFTP